MRQVKRTCYWLMTVLALSVTASSTALGGELRNLPEKITFSYKSTPGEVTKLVRLAGGGINCKKLTGGGEFTSERLGPAEYKFSECENPTFKVPCTGLGDTSGNITVKGEFHTRHLLPNSEGVNVGVLVSGVHFSCSGVLFVDTGCQASMDLLTKKGEGENVVNKLQQTIYVEYLQSGGEQVPSEIDTDSSLGMEGCVLLTKEGNGASQTSGMLGTGTIEKFEVGGNPVTELVDLSGTL